MGLDMDLVKVTSVSGQNRTGTCDIFIDGERVNVDMNKISCIEENVAYWRKANGIHNWFVDNVQRGEDDYGKHDVSYGQMKRLLWSINATLSDPNNAGLYMPTSNFVTSANDEYDDYYFKMLEYTKEVIEKCLEDKDSQYDWMSHYYYKSIT